MKNQIDNSQYENFTFIFENQDSDFTKSLVEPNRKMNKGQRSKVIVSNQEHQKLITIFNLYLSTAAFKHLLPPLLAVST